MSKSLIGVAIVLTFFLAGCSTKPVVENPNTFTIVTQGKLGFAYRGETYLLGMRTAEFERRLGKFESKDIKGKVWTYRDRGMRLHVHGDADDRICLFAFETCPSPVSGGILMEV
jgi:hypothetical protein